VIKTERTSRGAELLAVVKFANLYVRKLQKDESSSTIMLKYVYDCRLLCVQKTHVILLSDPIDKVSLHGLHRCLFCDVVALRITT
jgi:hypothetical protein